MRQEERQSWIEEAVVLHGAPLLALLRGFLGPDEAQDALQAVWMKAYRSLERARDPGRAWLSSIARNEAYDRLRKRKRSETVLPPRHEDKIPERQAPPCQPGTPEEEAQMQKRFWENFDGLAIDDLGKKIFWLSHRLGYTVREIADQTSLGKSAVAERLKLVTARCLAYLNEEEETLMD